MEAVNRKIGMLKKQKKEAATKIQGKKRKKMERV